MTPSPSSVPIVLLLVVIRGSYGDDEMNHYDNFQCRFIEQVECLKF